MMLSEKGLQEEKLSQFDAASPLVGASSMATLGTRGMRPSGRESSHPTEPGRDWSALRLSDAEIQTIPT